MKHIFTLFIFCIILASHQASFAMDYKSTLSEVENPTEINSQSNINRAKLLCTHVNNFEKNIENIMSKYGLKSDQTLLKTLILVDKMQGACEVIKTQNIERNDANIVITSIVTDLSQLNKGIKEYLKIAIEDIKSYHTKYKQGAIKISLQIDILTKKMRSTIERKKEISPRDRQILQHIKRLEKKSKTLKGFGDLEFYKKQEIRASLIRVIKDIRSEIRDMREL